MTEKLELIEAMNKKLDNRACLDVESWRIYTKDEMLQYLEEIRSKTNKKKKRTSEKSSSLAVRTHISPVDMYCYLKARFGEPNGFQTFLRKKDTSDNWIHWDFNLKAGDADIHISCMSREMHFVLSKALSDLEWLTLIKNIKADFSRVAKEKSTILKSLEKWVIFPNKFAEIAGICSELHEAILENIEGYHDYKTASKNTRKGMKEQQDISKKLGQRASHLYKSCLELSLLTPVLAEAFINMVILMLCKKEIRNDKSQIESFIRAHIHIRIFDLFYKCDGFSCQIDPGSEAYKKFKHVMDKRNHLIHGNIDPIREKIEEVYFEGTVPLFKESGDNLGKMFEALERQHQPQEVINNYEAVHMFLLEIVECLNSNVRDGFWRIMEDSKPGYDINRKKVGALFPEHTILAIMPGLKYDDELSA
jgi:hypothetical protein